MRLLRRKSDGSFELTSHHSGEPPPYAILSHTWTEGEEVTYNDLIAGTGLSESGYTKIRFCVEQAAKDGLDYSWVDTCCINKTTSDELSISINSMFRWYQRASKCYVYLSDVTVPDEVTDATAFRVTWEYTFRQSRWFTRGWTLQELLAPATVEFFSNNARKLGTKISLEQEIHEITRIPISALRGQHLSKFTIEERMNWSAHRRTSLKEDKVYCLFGIFGVFIPLIYGEGEEYATLRFKEEVQKRCTGNQGEIDSSGYPSQIVQRTPAKRKGTIRSRDSLLALDSLFRKFGFYGTRISEQDATQTDSEILLHLGVHFSRLPGYLGFNALELHLSFTMKQNTRSFGYELRAHNRVPAESPLMKACETGDVALIRQIIEEKRGGVNDQIISCGRTPLMIAIAAMHSEAVQFLLQNGADPNIPDDDQILPIFAVVGMNPHRSKDFEQLPPTWEHWLDILRLLIRHGASTNETVRGRSLAGVNIARHDECSQVLPYLRLLAAEDALDQHLTADNPSWPVVKNAVKAGTDTVQALKLLRACGVSVTRVLDDGRTTLHLAAHHCQDDEALSYLLANGCNADVNRQDQWGWTPLHYAVLARTSAEGQRPFSNVTTLIRNGADPSIKGWRNPGSSYHSQSKEFTGFELLEQVRYTRFKLLMDVLSSSGIDIEFSQDMDVFYDAEEDHGRHG